MKITKLEHSGIIIEKDGENIIFDPVKFTKKLPEINNVVTIIITHKHSDHFQPEVIARILQNSPNAKIFTTADTAPNIENAISVKAGDSHDVGNFKLDFFGKDHAAIIPGQIPCENIGTAVDGRIVNPGDSFDLPDFTPEVLFTPIAAPWCKISESIDYVKKAHPRVVIPIHDAVLSDLGKKFNENWLDAACSEIGAEFTSLVPNQSVSI